MPALDLNAPLERPPDPFAIPDEGVSLSDYAHQLASAGYGLVKSFAGAAEYATGANEPDGALEGVKGWASEGAQAHQAAQSRTAQRAAAANVLPGDGESMWDAGVSTRHAIGLNVVGAIPSLIASVIPGGLVARLAVGAGAAVGTAAATGAGVNYLSAGSMTAGDTYNAIKEDLEKIPDEELYRTNEVYRGLIDMGMDKGQARQHILGVIESYKPLVMGGITAVTSKMFGGVEGRVADRLAGVTPRAGRVRSAIGGGLGEMGQEFSENTAQEALQQTAAGEARGKDLAPADYDWHKIFEEGLKNAMIGGVSGGVVGGVTGGHAHAPAPQPSVTGDQSIDAALTPQLPSSIGQSVAEALTPVVPPDPNDQLQDRLAAAAPRAAGIAPASPGQEMAATLAAQGHNAAVAAPAGRTAAPVDRPVTVDPDQALALRDDPRDLGGDPDAIVDVNQGPPPEVTPPLPEGQPVVTPDVAQAITRPEIDLSGMGSGIAENMYDMLHAKHLAGDTTEAGAPSANLQVAQQVAERRGAPLDRDTFKTVVQDASAAREGKSGPEFQQALRDVVERHAPSPELPPVQAPQPETPPRASPAGGVAPEPVRTGPRVLEDAASTERVAAQLEERRREEVARKLTEAQLEQAAKSPTPENLKREGPRLTENKRAQLEAGVAKPVSPRELKRTNEQKRQANIAERVKAAFEQLPYTEAVRRENPAAIRQYMRDLVAAAGNPDLPKRPSDPHLQHLQTAQILGQGAGKPTDLVDFMANDFALRRGDPTMLTEYRATQALKKGKSTDAEGQVKQKKGKKKELTEEEQEQLETKEPKGLDQDQAGIEAATDEAGADRSELYNREAPGEELTTVSGEEAAVGTAEETAPEPEPVVQPRERPKVVTSEEDIRIMSNRAGQFAVEKRRKITPPGKKPVVVERASDLVPVRKQVETSPSAAQIEAGNYPKGHVSLQGLDIAIETPKGADRKGTTPDGKEWSVKLKHDYGYIKGTEGADGSHIDTYVGPHPESRMVFVVDQQGLDGKFDEHKALVGFNSPQEARNAYHAGFSDNSGPDRLGKITPMTMEQFKRWIAEKQNKPVAPDALAKIEAEKPRTLPQTEEAAAEEVVGQLLAEDTPVGAPRASIVSLGGGPLAQPRSRTAERRVLRSYSDPSVTVEVGQPQAFRDVIKKSERNASIRQRRISQFAAKHFGHLIADVPVYVLPSEDVNTLLPAGVGNETQGYFQDTSTGGYIVLSEEAAQDPYAIAHEGVHAALTRALENNDAAFNDLSLLRRHMKQAFPRAGLFDKGYGFTDNHEFIAEMLSNPEFQRMAMMTPVPLELQAMLNFDTKPASMWDAFVQYVRSLFRIKGNDVTVLEATLRQVEKVMSGEGSEFAEAGPHARVTREDVKHQASAVNYGFRKAAINVAALSDITRQYNDTLFPDSNGLRRVERGLQATSTMAAKEAKPSEKLGERWGELAASNPEQFNLAVNFTATANIHDIDPSKPQAADKRLMGDKARWYQAKEVFQQLRDTWLNRFDDTTKQLLLDTTGHFRELQSRLAHTLAETSLNALPEGHLTEAQRAEIIDATLKGELTEKPKTDPDGTSHEELINNTDVFRALQQAEEMQLKKGMYFPQMRHGNYVVRTTEPVGDLHGGVIIHTGKDHVIVEFRAPEDKIARAAWERFAKNNTRGPTVTSLGKKRFLTGTNQEISEADARGQSHDVAYRARLQTQGVDMFTTYKEALKFIDQMKKAGLRPDEQPLLRAEAERKGTMDSAAMAVLMRNIDKRTDLNTAQKELLKTTARQAAIQLLPGQSIKHRALKSRGIKGSSDNIAYNTVEYGRGASWSLAKLTHMPEVNDALKAMREEQAKGLLNEASPLNQPRGMVISEIEKRVQGAVSPSEQPQIVKDLMSMSFWDKLGSLSTSMVNATQAFMLTGPVLGGIYGNMKAAAALGRAYRDMGYVAPFWQGFTNTASAMRSFNKLGIDTRDPLGSIRKRIANDTTISEGERARLAKMFEEIIDVRGLAGGEAGLELGKVFGGGARTRAIAKVDRVVRQLPHAVEAANRVAAALAAYRLAYGVDGNHERAVQHAIDILQQTQFNYAHYNAPQFMNKAWLSPVLQFKKYGLAAMSLMVDMVHRAFRGATPTERRIAYKQLMNVVGLQIAVAGALSLPGVELLKVGFMLASALGFGGGWDDQERKFRKLMDETVGKSWGEMVTRGVVSRWMGVDLSSRMSYADLAFFGEPKGSSDDEIYSYLGRTLAGAPGNLLMDWRSAMIDAGNGDWDKAAIKLVPMKIAADFGKALKGRFDETVRDPMTGWEAGLQTLGFRPARLAEKGEERGGDIAKKKDAEAEKKQLEKQYFEAKTKGELTKLKGQIIAHNKMVEEQKLGFKNRVMSPSTMDGLKDERAAKRRTLIGAD